MIKFKKIFLILVLVGFSVLVFSFCLAQRELEIAYPGTEPPVTTKTWLPDYIKYIFRFAVIFGGLAAFAATVWGGFRFLTSAGDPTRMSEAREQIFAGVLGLVLLLTSWLILDTVNPQLLFWKPTITPIEAGVILYKEPPTEKGGTWICPGQTKEGRRDKIRKGLAVHYNISVSDLTPFSGENKNQVRAIEFLSGNKELFVKIFPEINFKGNPIVFDDHHKNECRPFSGSAGSLLFEWQYPGVHLFSEKDFKGMERVYAVVGKSYASLGDFNDQAMSLLFKNIEPENENEKIEYGVVLHEHLNHGGKMKICFEKNEDLDTCGVGELNPCQHTNEYNGITWKGCLGEGLMTNRASSLTVFQRPPSVKSGAENKYWTDWAYWISLYQTTKDKDTTYLTKVGYIDLYTSEKFGAGDPDAKKVRITLGKLYGSPPDKDLPLPFKPYLVFDFSNITRELELQQDYPEAIKCYKKDPNGNAEEITCPNLSGQIRSFRIVGNYLVILCTGSPLYNSCEVFFESDADLNNNPNLLKRDWFRRVPYITSMLIAPIIPQGE